ncbi:uroplakin-2 isoform X2 [Dasypus novemcinctus]|uniref:uroplakin-2 isoform X2 n=1 Tax=Dasypus novemcinctus TaxID=9361 RepID=UPI000C831828|nr:uroplakin-2 isoform X2 [Dasypus novemcinctus]
MSFPYSHILFKPQRSRTEAPYPSVQHSVRSVSSGPSPQDLPSSPTDDWIPCLPSAGRKLREFGTKSPRGSEPKKMVKSSFVVPPCRGSRALVSVVDSGAGFTVTRLSAYQVTNLVPGTKYYISYLVKKGTSTESSKEIPMSTLPRRKVESIGLGMARTGGMVVITVLLSVAMFLLVLGFIIALALGAQK